MSNTPDLVAPLHRLGQAAASPFLSTELRADIVRVVTQLRADYVPPATVAQLRDTVERLHSTCIHRVGRLRVGIFAGVTTLEAGALVGLLDARAGDMLLICPVNNPTEHIEVEADLVEWWTDAGASPACLPSEDDPIYRFRVRDYATELVGRYSKQQDLYYIQRGDGTCYAYHAYRVSWSGLIWHKGD